jgi:hypothetical protein
MSLIRGESSVRIRSSKLWCCVAVWKVGLVIHCTSPHEAIESEKQADRDIFSNVEFVVRLGDPELDQDIVGKLKSPHIRKPE